MASCANCGRSVSPAFARVFGDNRDRLHGCPHCLTYEALVAGEGADAG